MTGAPIYWHPHRDEILRLREGGASYEDVARGLQSVGVPATAEQVRGACRRWGATGIRQGTGVEHTPQPILGTVIPPQGTAYTPPPAPTVTREVDGPVKTEPLPRDCLPPEPPPDHDVSVDDVPRRVLTIADAHVPIHDPDGIDAAVALARSILNPATDTIVINGDLLDAWSISGWDKDPARLFAPGARLQEEIEIARPILCALAATAKRVEYIPGNHCFRLERLVRAHPGLFGLAALEWRALLQAPANVHFHAYGAQLRIGPVTWMHGDRVISDRAVHFSHLFLRKYPGRSIVYAHHHRMQTFCISAPDENGRPHTYSAVGCGHLTRPECHRDYVLDPSWQAGVLVTDYWRGNGGKVRFAHHPLMLIDGRLSYDGRLYGKGLCQ